DWTSDVCSSDLTKCVLVTRHGHLDQGEHLRLRKIGEPGLPADLLHDLGDGLHGAADRSLFGERRVDHHAALARSCRSAPKTRLRMAARLNWKESSAEAW